MTKAELENNEIWKQLPPDTEIVFNTHPDVRRCRPLWKGDLTYHHVPTIVFFESREGAVGAKYGDFLVIDTKDTIL